MIITFHRKVGQVGWVERFSSSDALDSRFEPCFKISKLWLMRGKLNEICRVRPKICPYGARTRKTTTLFVSLPETESSSHVILRLLRPLGQGLAAGYRRLVLFLGLLDHLLIWLGLSAVSWTGESSHGALIGDQVECLENKEENKVQIRNHKVV